MQELVRRLQRILLCPPLSALAGAAVLLAVCDHLSRLAGDSVIPGGPLDESAHLLSTLLVMWALGRGASRRFMVPALIASVAIDVDHVPGRLGTQFLTAGTPRPYTHSLLTIAVVLGLAGLSAGRARRSARTGTDLWLGVALGLAFHFWRDLSEGASGVSLLWPLSDAVARLPHWSYLAMMGAFLLLAARLDYPWLGRGSQEELLRGSSGELFVGQLRRNRKLGSEAVYRVCECKGPHVSMEVVSAPGLRPGQRFKFTRAAVELMEALPDEESPVEHVASRDAAALRAR